MHKVFGARENVKYTDREGAYLIPFHGNQVGVVRTSKGFFFLGGGLNDGESHIECIKRECVEEAGCEVSIKDAVCSAEIYYKHETIGYFHPIQTYYMGDVVSEGQAPSESDHEFMWVEYEVLKGKMYLEMQNWALEECLKSRNKIEWIFFDVGSTLVDEQFAYEHRMRDIADLVNTIYEKSL